MTVCTALALACGIAGLPGCSIRQGVLAPPTRTVFYPPPPDAPRVALLTSINDASILGHKTSRMSRFLFGAAAGEPLGPIGKPFGLAALNNELFVCDTQQNVVHVFDFKASEMGILGDAGRGRLLKPVAVAVDEEGNRYVADAIRREVVVFSPTNEAIRALKPVYAATPQTPSDATPPDFKPVALAVYEGKLFVINVAKHRIEVIDPHNGELLAVIGEKGTGPGQMLFPNGIAISPHGQLYVTDLLNCRVQVFSVNGTFVQTIGRPGDRAGEFARPKHAAVGPDGIVYIVDAAFQRVQMFDAQGRVLMLFGGPREETLANDPTESLTLPAGVCVSRSLLPYFTAMVPKGFTADYLVFVSDQFAANKINVYALGRADGS